MSKTTEWRHDLGVCVKDTVTGLTGILTSRCEYLNGCRRVAVQGPVGADGKMPDAYYIDEEQIAFVNNGVFVPNAAAKADTGGLQNDPKPRQAPPR